MSQAPSFLHRLGRLFRRSSSSEANATTATATADEGRSLVVQTRTSRLRPWGRNSAAIAQLQDGFQLLTELMSTIRQNLESQGRRQDELIMHISALPKVLETIPESTRMQGETLKAIHQQLVSQSEQQQILGEILDKLAESGGDQKDLLEGVRERMETLQHQDQAMADSLNTVSSALESTSRNSAASADVLRTMRDNLASHDNELESLLQRQASRFTTMLATAILLSVMAVMAVVVLGYLMLHAGK
ncbi:MAG: hypothetical protein ABR964_08945 [Tepidisphaeraceae bacterium]|jgi:chromosome segregation ATPase